jgi:hypothetical protein
MFLKTGVVEFWTRGEGIATRRSTPLNAPLTDNGITYIPPQTLCADSEYATDGTHTACT